jgi:magnesium transporter
MTEPIGPSAVAGRRRPATVADLAQTLSRLEPWQIVHRLEDESEATAAAVLARFPIAKAVALLPRFAAERRLAILKTAPPEQREQWLYNQHYPKGSVGRLMQPVLATFEPTMTVREVVERLREAVREAFITYGYVVDAERRFIGVLVMRELLLADPGERVGELMITNPFFLRAAQPVAQILPMLEARHFSEYPVCDDEDRIVGVVRGYALFQEQLLNLSAQPAKMAGVDREECLQTNTRRSLSLRHPWLQVNLLGSLLAAGVVGLYEGTILQVIAVAAFVPVMVGQSAGTAAQSLAVALRGFTLGEFDYGQWRLLVKKEAVVGLANGALVGLTSAAGIYGYAVVHGHAGAGLLALVMFLAMVVSTVVSGVVGGAMPLVMKRLGYDPATAATILVGSVARIASIGAFLALTQWILL